MALKASVAKKIADAKAAGGGNRLCDKKGDYVLAVRRILINDGHKGLMFIPEMRVMKSTAHDGAAAPWPEGSNVSCAWPLNKGGDAGSAALGNIKEFCAATFGLNLDGMTEEQVLEEVGPYVGEKGDPDSEAARGVILLASTYDKKIERGGNAGKVGTFAHFTHISEEDGNSAEAIEERKALIDASEKGAGK
jgi:hypothetical protein